MHHHESRVTGLTAVPHYWSRVDLMHVEVGNGTAIMLLMKWVFAASFNRGEFVPVGVRVMLMKR